MGYCVGIDFGTTFTAAAVRRDGDNAQTGELVPLGDDGACVASVVFVAPDGSLVVGDAAERRAVTDPDRVVREVKGRIGDQTPVLVGGEPIGAHTLAARFIRWVVDRVVEREGGPPSGVGVTYPASWGPHKRRLLFDALLFAGVENVLLVTEPDAAAAAYTASRHVVPGSAIGVYDLGGGTFDAAVVRQLKGGGFELAGRPERLDSLGGIDFDEAVFERVRASLGKAWAGLDFSDPLALAAAAALRRECTEAKKTLSSDTEVTIPVMLPGAGTRVRMVRAEFEALIAPAVEETVEAMRRATESAELAPAELSAVLLVGGSSRIPLVAQRVSAELDLPVTMDSDPKAVVAIGAALTVSSRGDAATITRKPTVIVADEPAAHGRTGRQVLTMLAGLAACAAALVALAGIVGTDVMPGSGADDDLAAPVVDEQGAGDVAKDAVDPWTGEPYTSTTAAGPTRPQAEPAGSPISLSPKPSTARNRATLIAGKPSETKPTNGPADTSRPGQPVTTTQDTPPPVTTTQDTPPPVTTTQDTPPPVTTTQDTPPAATETGDPTPPDPTT
jgi:actin-like ATPase involved in cell morphogenesis